MPQKWFTRPICPKTGSQRAEVFGACQAWSVAPSTMHLSPDRAICSAYEAAQAPTAQPAEVPPA